MTGLSSRSMKLGVPEVQDLAISIPGDTTVQPCLRTVLVTVRHQAGGPSLIVTSSAITNDHKLSGLQCTHLLPYGSGGQSSKWVSLG